MIHTVADFSRIWEGEIEATQKILKHLTTGSLSRAVTPEGRTLGRIAWHVVTSIPEMMEQTGLSFAGSGPDPDDPVPSTAKEIFDAYNAVAIALLEQVKGGWTDATLDVEDAMYGEKWKRGMTLGILVFHQIHHRGQMTVLMRQAGLKVPGVFGPSLEEWVSYGMQPPVV